MALSDMYDLSVLGNQIEEFVFDELESQLDSVEHKGICKCNDCILDMACFALNQLSPSYSSSLMGKIYNQEVYQNEIPKVKAKVREAIIKISQNPLCGNNTL